MPNHHAVQNPPEQPIEEIRIELTRKILTLLGMHLKCREPICRRARRCAGPDLRCKRDFPAPPCSDEERARIKSDFYKALQERAAEIEAGEITAGEETVSAPKREPYPCKTSPGRAPSRRRGAPT